MGVREKREYHANGDREEGEKTLAELWLSFYFR